MAIFKIVNHSYSDQGDIFREINYILNPVKCIYTGVNNLISNDPILLTHQFMYIKNYYRKNSGKQLEHFVLSLDTGLEEKDVTLHSLNMFAILFSRELDNYQMVYAIHKSNTNAHIHFIMNSIDMYTGKHFHISKKDFKNFMNNIAELLSFENIALAGYTYYDENGLMRRGETHSFLYQNKIARFY